MTGKFMKRLVSGVSIAAIVAIELLSSGVFCSASAGETADRIDSLLQARYYAGEINGAVLVAKGGAVIYKKAFGLAHAEWEVPNTPDSRFNLFSVTKPFSAILVLQLAEERKLALDDPVIKFLPWYRADTGRRITIHHLLTHTHGIPDIRYDALPLELPADIETFIRTYASGDPEFEPGTRFKYSGLAGYTLVAAIIEQVTGKSYEQVLEERILIPLGMKESGFIHYDQTIPFMTTSYQESTAGKRLNFFNFPCNGASSIYSTVNDLFVWNEALWHHKLLSAASVRLMSTSHTPPDGPEYGYGMYCSRLKLGPVVRDVYLCTGGGRNILCFIPFDGHFVALLNNIQCPKSFDISVQILNLLYRNE